MALCKEGVVPLSIPGVKEFSGMKPRHPKVHVTTPAVCVTTPLSHVPQNAELGDREVWYSSRLLLEGEDAYTLTEQEKVTLINWGNVLIQHIHK